MAKSPSEVVQEVMQGRYGNGEARKERLKSAGYSWIEIQSLINKQFGVKPVAATPIQIVAEIQQGLWGDSSQLEERITNAGFSWSQIKNLLNINNTTAPSSMPSNNNKIIVTNTVQSKGIDISAWQGNIDFSQVKTSGVDFIILREGYGTSIDQKFLEYTAGAKAVNIPIPGVYHFCYSTTKEEIIQEAQSCLANVVKAGLPKNTIIFFDFEYDTVTKARNKGVILTKTHCIDFTNTFLSVIESRGYRTGIYCNLDYYKNMYTPEIIKKHILWIAQYTKRNPDIIGAYHQYSDQGFILGINGNVDLNTCYIKTNTPITNNNNSTSSTQTTFIRDFTKYNGKISNCGKDENGGYRYGRAGDQSGQEWWIVNWYGNWNCVLRHPNKKVREYIAELAIEAAQNENIGYDQTENRTYWAQLQNVGYWPKKIVIPCEADCSAGVIANVMATGYLLNKPELQNINATYTGNMRSGFAAAGFQVLTDYKYLTGPDYLLPGDILLNDASHTATVIGYGKYTQNQASQQDESEVETPIENNTIHKVIAKVLNIRSGPGVKYPIIGYLYQGTNVNILDTAIAENGKQWYKIDQGYVSASYID